MSIALFAQSSVLATLSAVGVVSVKKSSKSPDAELAAPSLSTMPYTTVLLPAAGMVIEGPGGPSFAGSLGSVTVSVVDASRPPIAMKPSTTSPSTCTRPSVVTVGANVSSVDDLESSNAGGAPSMITAAVAVSKLKMPDAVTEMVLPIVVVAALKVPGNV